MSTNGGFKYDLRESVEQNEKAKEALRILMRENGWTGEIIRSALHGIENDMGEFDDKITKLKSMFKFADDVERVGIFKKNIIPVLEDAYKRGVITEEEKNGYSKEFGEIAEQNQNTRKKSDNVQESQEIAENDPDPRS